MLQKFLLIVLVLLLCLGLIACGKDVAEDMVLVAAGTTAEDNGLITVENDFYLGKYHVTQAEFEEIMGFNPSFFINPNLKGDSSNRPVESVSWYDAVIYCNKLSELEGLDKYYNISDIEYYEDYYAELFEAHPQNIVMATVWENEGANGYRLPTCLEWEYAARGGKDGEATLYAGSDNLDQVGWYGGNSDKANFNGFYKSYIEYSHRFNTMVDNAGTMPVAEKKANELDLYDMSGNVYDWTNTIIDNQVTICGGSWFDDFVFCELDFRSQYPFGQHVYSYLGFRLCRFR
ncbi:formylglycine-generating enzyme family protein [Natronospora cellulosivora (SeqCode)]